MFLEKQQQAHDLYFNTDKTQQEIADILDVNRRTIYLWVKQGRWAEMKAAARQMPSIIQQNLYNYINAVSDKINKRDEDDRCPTMEEVEKMRKLLNMANSIKKQHTGAYMEAFQELRLFIYNRDSAFAKELAGHIDAYVRGTMGDKEFMTRKQRKDNVLEVTANLAKEERLNYQEQEETEKVEAATFVPTAASSPLTNNTTPELVADSLSSDTASEDHALTSDITVQKMGAECDKNGIFCDKNIPCHPGPGNEPIALSTTDYTGANYPIVNEKYPFPDDLEFDEVMRLSIAFRPSPFIDGDTVWVKEMDDVESPLNNFGVEWGVLKMGHTVRRYPDIDASKVA